jgi:hypothetical protein
MQNNEAARTEHSIIKADPGWFAVACLRRAGSNPETGERWDDGLTLSPVIAWEIERHDEPGKPRTGRLIWHDVTPIIVDDPPSEGIRYVKRPDGSFVCGGVLEDNEKDAVAHIKSKEDEAREAEARQRHA